MYGFFCRLQKTLLVWNDIYVIRNIFYLYDTYKLIVCNFQKIQANNQVHQNMKKSQLISSFIFLLVMSLSFSLSWATISSSLVDFIPGSGDLMVSCIQSNSNNVTAFSQLIFTPL